MSISRCPDLWAVCLGLQHVSLLALSSPWPAGFSQHPRDCPPGNPCPFPWGCRVGPRDSPAQWSEPSGLWSRCRTEAARGSEDAGLEATRRLTITRTKHRESPPVPSQEPPGLLLLVPGGPRSLPDGPCQFPLLPQAAHSLAFPRTHMSCSLLRVALGLDGHSPSQEWALECGRQSSNPAPTTTAV